MMLPKLAEDDLLFCVDELAQFVRVEVVPLFRQMGNLGLLELT